MDPVDITTLQKYYCGFYIDEPVGNNAFSFDRRITKKIYVPLIIKGNVDDLSIGEEVVFSEIIDGQQINCRGLRQFVYSRLNDKDVFIFDNHNQAFFFWLYALKTGRIERGLRLVHVDQHRDTREPPQNFPCKDIHSIDLKAAFEYTNFKLNVGNFIKPALAAGLFSQLDIIDSRSSFERSFDAGFVLDLDMDIFSKDMAYIDEQYKIDRIKKLIASASLITIATSPFFMDQTRAINLIKILLT